jgi:hypothetical protein
MPDRFTTNITQYNSSSVDIIYRKRNAIHTNLAKQMWPEWKQQNEFQKYIAPTVFQILADHDICDFVGDAALST